MAERSKTDGPSITTNKGHNVAAVREIIADAARKVISLKAQRGEIGAEITEVKSRVKGAGIKLSDFNIALRLYELDRDDRSESLDNIRVCFEALDIGSQGDLFPAKARPDDTREDTADAAAGEPVTAMH